MFKGYAIYYTNIEPITTYEFKAFTKKGAKKKVHKYINYINSMGLGNVYWIDIYFRGNKV